jgi:methionyl-tRNA synthetase
MQRFYITTTLPYVNAPLHMGHALEFVRADAIARYKKLMGCEVFFNTGTDEHGSKIYLKAEEAGLSPQAFVDRGFAVFKEQVSMFGVSDDIHFIRTTDSHHIKAAQAFWMHVMDNGFIYKKNYQTKYCIGCESEKTDSELVEGKCPDHGTIPELIDEENYFFKYSAFQDLLLGFYQAHPNFIIPSFRMNEMKAFIERGLEDFSISRLKSKMPWGIPVPGDDEHVMYVWFDALTNYISTLGWPNEKGNFSNFWKNGNPTQYCGKDNTRFQGIMWQAMLMAADLPNSHQIIVNGFITGEGGIKMSKTLGNTTDPKDIVDEYGTDALRMFLLSEVSNFEDSPFTVERFKDAYNARLANGLGNLASRILTLSEKYLDVCPPIPETSIPQAFFDRFEAFDISGACGIIWDEVAALDKLIQDTQPFKTIKTDEGLR